MAEKARLLKLRMEFHNHHWQFCWLSIDKPDDGVVTVKCIDGIYFVIRLRMAAASEWTAPITASFRVAVQAQNALHLGGADSHSIQLHLECRPTFYPCQSWTADQPSDLV
jgi:hypothetical protein